MPKGFTLWFTGLSASGKSTLAERVRDILLERGMKVEVLDGDIVRQNLSKGLGFSKDYEPPDNPEVVVDTANENIDTCVGRIIATLEQLTYIPAGDGRGYSDEEEESIKQRLRDLGYI